MTAIRKVFLVWTVTLFLSSAALAAEILPAAEWKEYAQMGGGKLYLPGDWEVNALSTSDYKETPQEDGTVLHQSSLFAAGREQNACIASVGCWWYSGRDGRFVSRQFAEGMAESWIGEELEERTGDVVREVSLTRQNGQYGSLWRYELLFSPNDSGNMGILLAFADRGGFAQMLSIRYFWETPEQEKYWRSAIEEILRRWRPGEFLSRTLGADPAPEGWQKVILQNAGVFYVPADWKTVSANNSIQTVGSGDFSIQRQTALVMLGEEEGQASLVFQVYSSWGPGMPAAYQAAIERLASAEKLEDKDTGLIGIEPFSLGTQGVMLFLRGTEYLSDPDSRTIGASFRHGDKAVLVGLTRRGSDERLPMELMKQVLAQWKADPPEEQE